MNLAGLPTAQEEPSYSLGNDHISPFISVSEDSAPLSTSIDSVLSRDLAMHILSLYFEHV